MPVIGIGGKITDIRQGRGKNPAGFNYNSSQFCNDNSTIQTPTAITPGGTYSISPALAGFNNSNGTFTPNSASSITGSQQYTVTHTLGTGEVAQSVITIFESFTVTITGPTSICDGATSDITLVATGAPAGSTYLWTPGNLTTSSIDVRPTTQTVYDVTVTNGACSDVDGHVVSINPKPSATITGDSSFCSTGGAATLTAGNPGTTTPYTYSWFLNGNSTGGNTNSITVSQEGNYTLQISDGNGCVSDLSPTFAVSRTPDDVATVTYPSTICKVPVGTGGASGSFALDGYFPLYLDYNDAAANSSDGSYHTHVINGLDYYMPNSGIVIYHGNYSLTTTPVITGQGGTFNNPTGLSINTQTGVIDKNASTAGTYTVEYTTNGSCAITVSNTVTINDLDNASMSYSASEYCQDVTDPVPTKSSTGTFSSSSGLVFTNSTTGEIDLDASTPGTYKIGFVTNGTCPNSGPLQTVTVTAREIATFNYSAGSYCQNAASNPTPSITGTTGGTFSSTTGLSINSTTGEIDLAASTVGSYVVTYTTAGTCSASSTQNVTVAAADVVSLSYPASSYPQSGTDPSPTFSPQNGGEFTATPAGLSINDSTGVIDLSESEINSYTITYTSGGTCPNTATFNLSITSVSAAFNYSASEYCENAATDPTPTVTGTSGGVFSATLKVVPFQMQFEVASGVSKTITIPSTVGTSYTVDWGDGATTTETTGNISHTYNDGNNTDVTNPIVSIGATGDTGPFTRFSFLSQGSDNDLIDVPQWGNIEWTSMGNMFYGCGNSNFTSITATDTPNLSNVTTTAGMFRACTNLATINNLNNWDTSNVTDMNRMFLVANSFNSDCSNWDVSNVENMSYMFQNCFVFNQDLGNWDVGSATNMQGLFQASRAFNHDIGNWDVSNVTDMSFMFYTALSFNQDIDNWNISSVTSMANMFRGASSFTQNLTNWDVSNITNVNRMFLSASSFNGDVSTWNLDSASNMDYMFHASAFNQNLSNWNLRTAGTSMIGMTSPSVYSQANYTDTMVGWAVYVYTNSGPFNVQWTLTSPSLDLTRTSDNASGQTYAVKYGADWTATGWTNAQDAYDYLTGATAGWTIN